MISCPETATTSVMCSVTGLACQSSQVKMCIENNVCVCVLVLKAYVIVRVLVSTLTGWVNRFAQAGDTALEVAETTAMRVGLSLSLFFSRLVSMEPKWNHY